MTSELRPLNVMCEAQFDVDFNGPAVTHRALRLRILNLGEIAKVLRKVLFTC